MNFLWMKVKLSLGHGRDLLLVTASGFILFPDHGFDLGHELCKSFSSGIFKEHGRFNGVQFGSDLASGILPGLELFEVASAIFEAGQGHLLAGLKRSKERKQLVIVFLEQRIEFVIVAPRALEAESEEGVRGGFGQVG